MKSRYEVDTARLIELFSKGFSQRRIAEMLGCSEPTVSRLLRELGFKGKR
jgi:predicted transcriptional regulator